nr:putative disease resistance protein RGA3 [Arachis hypogaea]XP_029154460.1 putative disease resistance protein RGA3 [Arachis hypogaea]
MILFRVDIGKRMKANRDRFLQIDEERRRFELQPGVVERLQEDVEWRQTNQDTWEKLKYTLQCGSGTNGASILVTTRLESVASIMGTFLFHHLLPLSEDENWLLFKHYAFGQDREECAELVTIGKEIVKKCAGSPLAF